jgi:hypothetical protein
MRSSWNTTETVAGTTGRCGALLPTSVACAICNVLPDGPEAAIRAQAEEIIEAGKGGGIIIGAHSIGPDIPVRNYLCYHQTIKQEGMFNP